MNEGSVGSTGNNNNAANALLALSRSGGMGLARSNSATSVMRREMRPPSKGRFMSAFFIMMVGLLMLVIGAISVPAMKPYLTASAQSAKALQVANASLVGNLQKNGLRGKNSSAVSATAVNLRLPVVSPVPFGTRVNRPNHLIPSDPQNAMIAASGARNNFNWSPNLITAIVEQKTTPEFAQMMKRERGVLIRYCELDNDCVKFYTKKLKEVMAAASEGANMNIGFMKNAVDKQREMNNVMRLNMQKKGEKVVAPYLEPIVGALRVSAKGAGEILGEVPAGASWAFLTGVINTSVRYVTSQGRVTQGIILIVTLIITNFAVTNVAAFLNAMATLAKAGKMGARSAKAVASFLTACVSGLLRKAQTARQGGNTNAPSAADAEVNRAVEEVIAAVEEEERVGQ